ncbi:MAG: hypothetical protein PHE01_11080 [Methanosarcina sp.]|nr:hypothetical protein [Methanosarcina sp.]
MRDSINRIFIRYNFDDDPIGDAGNYLTRLINPTSFHTIPVGTG